MSRSRANRQVSLDYTAYVVLAVGILLGNAHGCVKHKSPDSTKEVNLGRLVYIYIYIYIYI